VKADEKQEYFSEDSQQVVLDAALEAWRLGHDHISSNHILLGLSKNKGLAGRILKDIGADYDSLYAETEKLAAPRQKTSGQLSNPKRAVPIRC